MTESLSRILAEVGRLSADERAEVAYTILTSLAPPDEQAGAAWEAKLARRVDDIKAGRAVGRPADEVFARLRARRP